MSDNTAFDLFLSPLYILAWASLAVNIVGAVVSGWLAIEAYADLAVLKSMLVNGDRLAIARHTLRTEVIRVVIQLLLIFHTAPGLFVSPERYSATINSLWLLILLSSFIHAAIGVLLLWKSFDAFRTRQKVLKDIVLPDLEEDIV